MSDLAFEDALFSPRPSAPLPIVVGGSSQAALKRAATLGDGWHGINQSPEQVTAALAAMDRYERRSPFRISLRTRMRIGGAATEASLTGAAASLAEQAERYASAGVDELVVEPIASDLDDFIDQITQFAAKVTP